MSSSLDKLKALTSRLEEKLVEKKEQSVFDFNTIDDDDKVSTPKPIKPSTTHKKKLNSEQVREENIERVKVLYEKLKIFEKSPNFNNIFNYKAMNLSGIGLKQDDFAQVREGKYIQIIAITYEPDKNGKKRAKNISLGYFGKAETLDNALKNEIVEFVLRWRYEKTFQNVEHYKELIEKIDKPSHALF